MDGWVKTEDALPPENLLVMVESDGYFNVLARVGDKWRYPDGSFCSMAIDGWRHASRVERKDAAAMGRAYWGKDMCSDSTRGRRIKEWGRGKLPLPQTILLPRASLKTRFSRARATNLITAIPCTRVYALKPS